MFSSYDDSFLMLLRDGKLVPTAIDGIMFGYDSQYKGYRIYYFLLSAVQSLAVTVRGIS